MKNIVWRQWHVAFLAVLMFMLGFVAGMPNANVPPAARTNLNNKISVDACLEHGGIPIFDAFASHYGEEAMMTSCQMAR